MPTPTEEEELEANEAEAEFNEFYQQETERDDRARQWAVYAEKLRRELEAEDGENGH